MIFLRGGREKPEISAPGSKIIAAKAESFTGTVQKSGTSMASPAVTGCIALMYGEALRLGKNVDIDNLRKILTTSGQLNPPAVIWDPRYGMGRISVVKMIQQVGSHSAPVSAANPTKKRRNRAKTKLKKSQRTNLADDVIVNKHDPTYGISLILINFEVNGKV